MTSSSEQFSAEDLVRPNAAALVESLRAVGYTLETAVADLIDNCVSAAAKHVWLDFDWSGENSCITVADDGIGMTEDDLVEAMRIGGKSPTDNRSKTDLGRFGLGLKTASFSQCRSLSVITRTSELQVSVRKWDLDHIVDSKDWHLQREISTYSKTIMDKASDGWKTIVILEKLDRVLEKGLQTTEKSRSNFFRKIEIVENHIGMVFHRFLEPNGRLKIFINGKAIRGWDPYVSQELASQNLGKEFVMVPSGTIEVTPHVLPHESKVSGAVYELAKGPKGWIAQQGFYVYRNKRLLVAGSWLDLGFQKRDQYALARIQVDLTNTMDSEWQIDIKKAKATPPALAREHLTRIARWTRERASDVFKGRRVVLARSQSDDYVFMWLPKVSNKRTSYVINRRHPLVERLSECLGAEKTVLTALLNLIESSVPIEQLWLNGMENLDAQASLLGDDDDAVLLAAAEVFKVLSKTVSTKQELAEKLLEIEPFNRYPQIIEKLVQYKFG